MSNPFEALELRLISIESLLQSALQVSQKREPELDSMNINEAAAMLKISVSRLYVAKQNYPHQKVYGRLMFSRKEITEFINSKRYKSAEERFEDRKIK